jgi:hypothetical protein
MNKEQLSDLFNSVFVDTSEGQRVLDILRSMSGYDLSTKLAKDERVQMYKLGKADLFAEILSIINHTNRKIKNGKQRKMV